MVASGKNCYFRRASYADLTLLYGSLFLSPTLPTFSFTEQFNEFYFSNSTIPKRVYLSKEIFPVIEFILIFQVRFHPQRQNFV